MVRLFDWFFRNRRTGRITIAQFPNAPLWIFLATVGLRRFVHLDGAARTANDWAGAGALGWWAVDEAVRGVNPWRRLLGLGASALVLAEVVSLLH